MDKQPDTKGRRHIKRGRKPATLARQLARLTKLADHQPLIGRSVWA